MANEKSPKKIKLDHATYMRTQRRLKKMGRGDESVSAVLRSGEVIDTPVGVYQPSEKEEKLGKLAQSFDLEAFGPGWEQMNLRQMALGQRLQKIANKILTDPNWLDSMLENATPNDIKNLIDLGVKIERTAMMGVMEEEKRRQESKEKHKEEHGGSLASKALQNPALVDAIHDLIDDDGDED